MKTFYSSTVDEVIKELHTDMNKGLSYKQLQENTYKYGENKIHIEIENGVIREIFNIRELYILIIAMFISLIFNNYIFTAILVTLLTSILGYNYKKYLGKKKKTEQLSTLNYTDVNIIRAGVRDKVKADILTVGDIVFLEKGNIISADIRIIESNNLTVNERNITSNDMDVRKYSTRIDRVKTLAEINNMAFRGTRVTNGSAVGVVVEVGNDTQIGRLLNYLKVSDLRSKIIGENLNKNSKTINNAIFSFTLVISFYLYFIKTQGYKENILILWFLAGTLNIFISQFIYSFIRAKKLKDNDIDIYDMSVLKRFRGTDVFFIPKLSALTEEEMILKTIYTSDIIHEDISKIDTKDVNIARMLSIGILNNKAIFVRDENKFKGSLIDAGILKYCTEKGLFKSAVLSKNPEVFYLPYDAEKGFSTSLNRTKRNYRANIKGAVDEVLEKCKYIMIDGIEKELTDEDIEKIKMIDFNISNKAYETIGFAYRSFNYEPSEGENIESNLVFVGIIGFENPKKINAKQMLQSLKAQNVLPIMITDDNKIVATRHAIELGVAKGMEEVISGVELLSLEKDEFIDILSRVRVLCRLTPSIKSKIISLFTSEGYSVVSTGENLSDIPSVILADIGISTGNKVAKLLKKMANINIKDNILAKFLVLIKEGKLLSNGIGRALILCRQIFFVELFLIFYNATFLKSRAFTLPMAITMNIIIVPIIMLIQFYLENDECEVNFYSIVFSVLIKAITGGFIVIVSKNYFSNEISNFIAFTNILLISSVISIKKYKEELKWIVGGSIGITLITNMTFIATSKIFEVGVFIKIAFILIFYIIGELILKKWRKSS